MCASRSSRLLISSRGTPGTACGYASLSWLGARRSHSHARPSVLSQLRRAGTGEAEGQAPPPAAAATLSTSSFQGCPTCEGTYSSRTSPWSASCNARYASLRMVPEFLLPLAPAAPTATSRAGIESVWNVKRATVLQSPAPKAARSQTVAHRIAISSAL